MSEIAHLVDSKSLDLSRLCKEEPKGAGGGGSDDGFLVSHINDFTAEEVKAEAHAFEESGRTTLPVTRVCPSAHGGPLDYPKVATTACARVGQIIRMLYYVDKCHHLPGIP